MSKGKPININSDDCFYAKKRPQIQKGFHKLFCVKYKIESIKLVECLEEYKIKHQTDLHHPWSRETTLDNCSWDFDNFLKIVCEKTGIKVGPKRKQKDGYNEWWQEYNIDGSFAYNGVTDDF